MAKSPEAFRTISEVADWLGTPAHVLRFWESRFAQVKPVKRAGGRRYYRPADMELLGGIKQLLHEDGMTIRGVQKLLRTEGVRHVASFSMPLDSPTEGAMPAQAAQDNAPAPAAADPVIEAPMSENVEPDPLDNLVALAPSQPVAAQPVNTAQVADDMAAVVPPEPAPAPEPTAGPEPEPAPETPEIAATDQHPAMAEIPPESDTATPVDAPVPPSEADHGSPAPLFQSAQSMRSSAEAVQPSVTDPVVPAQDTSAGAEAVAPTPPEPAHDMRPAPLGADIAEDPAPDAQFADAPLAPLPNIISLAQAIRAHRNGTDGPAVDAGMMARLYDQLIELRDQMRAKG